MIELFYGILLILGILGIVTLLEFLEADSSRHGDIKEMAAKFEPNNDEYAHVYINTYTSDLLLYSNGAWEGNTDNEGLIEYLGEL